jgi:hypothetical protein
VTGTRRKFGRELSRPGTKLAQPMHEGRLARLRGSSQRMGVIDAN